MMLAYLRDNLEIGGAGERQEDSRYKCQVVARYPLPLRREGVNLLFFFDYDVT